MLHAKILFECYPSLGPSFNRSCGVVVTTLNVSTEAPDVVVSRPHKKIECASLKVFYWKVSAASSCCSFALKFGKVKLD